MSSAKIIIAIDGHSSCGKSTIARAIAALLGYTYIDSGAMYRATTLLFIKKGLNAKEASLNQAEIEKALLDLEISFKTDENTGNQHTYLNGEDVESEIRELHVAAEVSHVSAISAVRKKLVYLQQEMGKDKGLVMDGRDIGTVVFPEAELKLFVTADVMVRTRRRLEELQLKGKQTDFETVKQNLEERDRIDSTRTDSPLRKADDAILLDNSNLDKEQQLEFVMKLVEERLGKA